MKKIKLYSKHILLSIFLLLNTCIHSQNKSAELSKLIDSNAKILPTLSGKAKVAALADLCYYTSTSDIDQSILYGNRAITLAQQLRDSLLLASCKNDVALSYFYKGNFDSCIFLAEQAYKVRLAKNKWRDAGASMSKVALGYYEKGKYGISLEKNLIALELFKKGDALMEVAKLQNNIGSIYERNNQLEEAKINYSQSAEAALQLKDYEGYVTAKGNYAIAVKKLGGVAEAIKIFNELIPICEKYCKEEYLSQIYQSLGVAERKLGNTERGLNYYLKAKAVYDKIGSLNGSSVININIGNTYADLKRFKEAEVFLNLGLTQAQEIKSLPWQKLAYFGLYDLERLKQNYEKANFYLEKYQVFSDSIYNEETQNKLGELQTQYNLQQKENTILVQKNKLNETQLDINKRNTYILILISVILMLALVFTFILQRNNINRKKTEINFQKQIQNERARIAKDLHDNMGAELTIISSAIDITAYGIERKKEKENLEQISDQVRKASTLMRDTIWTVSEEKISAVQFGIKIKEFADRTFKHKQITIHFKNAISEVNLRPESTLSLYRMVQEIINNAAKHSNAKNFYIDNFNNNEFSIMLQDDGEGFDLTTVERGYGLNNILQRANEITAKVNFDIRIGEHTKIEIVIDKESIWGGK